MQKSYRYRIKASVNVQIYIKTEFFFNLYYFKCGMVVDVPTKVNGYCILYIRFVSIKYARKCANEVTITLHKIKNPKMLQYV